MTTSFATRFTFAVALLAAFVPVAQSLTTANPPSRTAPSTPQDPVLPPPPSAGGNDDVQREMREIVARVERTLRAIDVFLSDAAAGELPLAVPEDSGLDDLLRSTQKESQNVVRDMDRLLEIAVRHAQQQQQSGGSGGANPPPQEGPGPLDRDRGNATQEPEKTPEKPDGRPEQGETPAGETPPKASDASDDAPENRANEPPPGSRDGLPQSRGDEGERWGELPPHAREVFRSQGGGDLPAQYRDWIDSYYRRLYRRP